MVLNIYKFSERSRSYKNMSSALKNKIKFSPKKEKIDLMSINDVKKPSPKKKYSPLRHKKESIDTNN